MLCIFISFAISRPPVCVACAGLLSGVAEMIARILVSLYAVPAFGFLAVCYGDPLAWIAADLFLVPAFIYVYKRLKKQVLTNASVTQAVA